MQPAETYLTENQLGVKFRILGPATPHIRMMLRYTTQHATYRLFDSLRILSILRLPSPIVNEDPCSEVVRDVSAMRDIDFSVIRLPWVLAAGWLMVLD
jgi:hypothetical protein